MAQATVAHSLVEAHAERVQELAGLYDSFDRAVAGSGTAGRQAAEAHRRLSARIHEWEASDAEAERRDVITLTADEREAMRESIARAIPYAERRAVGLPVTEREQEVVRLLQQFETDFPATLTRAAATRFHRCAARLRRLEEIDAPAFLVDNEPAILIAALESATAPIASLDIAFDPADRFARTFVRALEACLILEPGAAGAVDLGLGTSSSVAALLPETTEQVEALDEGWMKSASPDHPFARYPLVPRGRFCTISPGRSVRGDLDSTGPIGWAADEDVVRLARDLRTCADQDPKYAVELVAVAKRLESVAERGEAVIGLIEYLPVESDGERQWLIA